MAHKTVIKATLTTVTEVLWRWGRGIAHVCRWWHEGAAKSDRDGAAVRVRVMLS